MANKKNRIATFEDLKKRQDHAVKKPHGDQKVSAALDNFEAWLLANWKQALIGVAAFLVVVIVVLIAVQVRKSNAEKTRQEFANAITVEALEAAIAAHPDDVHADNARQRLAILCTDAENYDRAIVLWGEIEASSSAALHLKARAGMNKAYLLEQTGKTDEALSAFQGYAQNAQTTDSIRNEAICAAARLLAAKGRTDEAVKSLDSIPTGAPFAFEAKMLRDAISPVSAPAAEKPASETAKPAPAAGK